MKNKKEFFKRVEGVVRQLIELEPIRKRAESTFMLFEGPKIMIMVGSETQENQEMHEIAEKVNEIVVELGDLYADSYEVGDSAIKIDFKDYLTPIITEEEVITFLNANGLEILTKNMEDKEFCLEILNAKFTKHLTDEQEKIFNYFNN